MSRDANQFKENRFAPVRARLLCATALCLLVAQAAHARSIVPDKPSVELHLEVLRELQAASRGTSFAAPVQGRDTIAAAPLPPVPGYERKTPASQPQERLSASGRKIPSEQPLDGVAVSQTRTPVNAPFGNASAPLPPETRKPVNVAAKPKPASAPKAAEVAKVEEKKPQAPKPATPPKAAATPDISKLDFSKAEPPKPQDEKKLMEALEKEAPKPAAAPALPDIALPQAPAVPELKPDIALPKPPALAEQKPDALPPIPALPAPAPDVLVVQKKPDTALPPIPALPAPGEAAKEEKPLMPSLEKRMDTLFAKQPDKTGILDDKTTIEDPTEESKKKAEEARQAQLKAQEELKKLAATPEEAVLPKPAEKPAMKSTEIAALPELPKLENAAIPAASGDVDLPPPALPSLTPIMGEGAEKSSLDIVQPQEGVESKDTTPAAMLPLDAPDTLPKVTKGEAEQEAPALPPLELPAAAPKSEAAKTESLPPIPDFSAVKEEAPKEQKVAMAPLPKPEFVKPEATPEEAAPATIAEGSASVSLTFEKDKTDLDEAAKAKLNGLAQQIVKEERQVRIVSYAAGTAEQASIARRISLSRALQIRAHLIDRGVNQLKINVQALGNKEQAERADVYLK